MTQTLHIFRKDLRRLRWWLAVWVLLLGIQTASTIVGPPLALRAAGVQMLLPQIDSFTGAIMALMLALLVARLVHEEPLVGLDWFWVSRPYDWRSLLAAKLLLVVLAFVGLPFVTHVLVMAVFSANVADMARAMPSLVTADLRWALGWMVLAVLTRSLATFALALVSVLAALVLLMLATMSVVLWSVAGETPPDLSGPLADVSGSIVAEAIFLVAAVGVIAYVYRNRRFFRTLFLAGAGLAAVAIAPMIWPWRFAAVWPTDFTKDPSLSRSMRLALDFSAPPHFEEPFWPGRGRGDRVVQVPVRADLPPDFRIESTFTRSRLTFPDGHVIESEQSGGFMAATAPEPGAATVHPLQGMFPDLHVLPVSRERESIPVVGVITAGDGDISRYGAQPGRLTGTLACRLLRSRIVGAMPLLTGTGLRAGWFRAEILAVDRRHASCSVFIRHWRASPLWSVSPFRAYQFILRNLRRHEAIVGDEGALQAAISPGFLPFLALGMYEGADQQSGFDVDYARVDYPARQDSQVATPVIDRDWLAAAELVVLETTTAGWLTKTIAAENFQMQPVTAAAVAELRR
jgi:hypothetical protein